MPRQTVVAESIIERSGTIEKEFAVILPANLVALWFLVDMDQATSENPANGFVMTLHSTDDNWVTSRQEFGADWQGGVRPSKSDIPDYAWVARKGGLRVAGRRLRFQMTFAQPMDAGFTFWLDT